MGIKELFLASALSLSPETGKQKTVSDELFSYQDTIHQVMESKKNPYKIDENIMKVALEISKNNPIPIEYGYKVASNGKESYKQLLVNDILSQVKNNSAYNDLDDDEKDEFIIDLSLKIKGYDKKGVIDLLLEYGYSKDFAEKESNKIPIKLSGIPKITTEELENLAKLKFKDVIDNYIKTGKIPKGFEFFKEDLEKIKAIIKKGNEFERRGNEAERRGNEAEKLRKKIDDLIEKMQQIKDNSGIT